MRYAIIAILIVVVILIIATPVCNIVKRFDKISDSQTFEKGEKLNTNNLLLREVNSRKDTLIKLNGIRILNFWATWCKPCLDEMKSLQELQTIYPKIEINLLSFEDINSQRKMILEKK